MAHPPAREATNREIPSLPRVSPEGSARHASSKQVRPDPGSAGKACAVQNGSGPICLCLSSLLQKYLENYLNRLLTMSFYRNYHAMVRPRGLFRWSSTSRPPGGRGPRVR